MLGDSNATVYDSFWRLRGDSWGSLDDIAERLAAAASEQRPTERLVEDARTLFEVLEPIEHYWTFPGVRRLQRARRLFSAGDYDRYSDLVAGLNRELATDSDSYRRVRDAALGAADQESDPRDVAGVGRQSAPVPYFEVLIVDPTGVFHALSISRGKSIVNSHWIRDMVGFYGSEVFLAKLTALQGAIVADVQGAGPECSPLVAVAEGFAAAAELLQRRRQFALARSAIIAANLALPRHRQ